MDIRSLLDTPPWLKAAFLGAALGLLFAIWIALAASSGGFALTLASAILMVVCGVCMAHALRWRTMSFTDATTGLFNRRYLFTRLDRELRLMRRRRGPLGLIVLD